MGKVQFLIVQHSVLVFLLLVLIISLFSFFLMRIVPEAQTPESLIGLPIWLVAIWSPNIAAMVIWMFKSEFTSKVIEAFSWPGFSWWFLIALIPLFVAIVLLLLEISKGNVVHWSNFKMSYLFPLLLINLIMGPLGEELGWRSFLYPIIRTNLGWMASAIIVGVIWAIWHAPLWLIDSPQAKIPFWAFAVNVILLSILMSIMINHSHESIIGVVLLHLTFNLSLGIIDIIGSHEPGEFVIQSLYIYVPVVIILTGINEWFESTPCQL